MEILTGRKFELLATPTPYSRAMKANTQVCHNFSWAIASLQRKRLSTSCESSSRRYPASSFSSLVNQRHFSWLRGAERKTQVATRMVMAPSMRKRYCQPYLSQHPTSSNLGQETYPKRSVPLKDTPRDQSTDGAGNEPHLPDPTNSKAYFLSRVEKSEIVNLTRLVTSLHHTHEETTRHDVGRLLAGHSGHGETTP